MTRAIKEMVDQGRNPHIVRKLVARFVGDEGAFHVFTVAHAKRNFVGKQQQQQ